MMSAKDGRIRKNILLGGRVQIILKENQASGFKTKGVVMEILTNAAKHPHGIKVRLESGEVGRIVKLLSVKKGAHDTDDEPLERYEQPKRPKKVPKEIVMPWDRKY